MRPIGQGVRRTDIDRWEIGKEMPGIDNSLSPVGRPTVLRGM